MVFSHYGDIIALVNSAYAGYHLCCTLLSRGIWNPRETCQILYPWTVSLATRY
jgi:hypothetical protein